MRLPPQFHSLRRWFASIMNATLVAWIACLHLPALAIDLADYPLFSTIKVPGNLALALSVEYPTATSMAYISSYDPTQSYIGYFNPDMCYTYVYNSTTPSSSYFMPKSAATSHVCSGLWSGNFMNWVSMQTLDEFRWIMTGGYRSTDTATGSTTDTILTKTYSANSVNNKSITSSSSVISGGTPFTWTNIYSRTGQLGSAMYMTGKSNSALSTSNTTDYQGSSTTNSNTVYKFYINVAVCVSASLKESNCVQYPNSGTPVYKPEGLMQQYSSQLRFAAFGYLNDSDPLRDGGVLRARMNYIGPTQPVPGSADITNTSTAEWDATTGVMKTNPDPLDATDTNTVFGVTVTNSGAMNYLNKFGYSAQGYKSYDPVSEMYYAVLRYFKGQTNVSTYTSGATASMIDGFPVITKWTKADDSTMGADPIIYSCQKNFILGIGDANTHKDANLPGSSLATDSDAYEPAMPAQVSADTTVDVNKATNMVGQLEGTSSSLGTSRPSSGLNDTFYIAGLAYDAHVNDIRPTLTDSSLTSDNNMSGSQTVNTYWLDVLENQAYMMENQYYFATKYGGFTVPSGFSEYASSNGPSTIPLSAWYTNSDTNVGFANSTYSSGATFNTAPTSDKRPDNYFYGSSPITMKTGLTAAFNKISSELNQANSTTYATPTPNVTSGEGSYAVTYNPADWTSAISALYVTYDANGNQSKSQQWEAGSLLNQLSNPVTSRYIVTYCDAASVPSGIQFTATALAACPTTGRLNYASFANITGATSNSSTPAADYLAYLRGDRTNELSKSVSASNRIYRTRDSLLGDITDSKVTAVGAPSEPFYDLYNPGYTAFKRKYANRRTMLYVGSNDGMLHAFDGTLPSYISTTTRDSSTGISTTTNVPDSTSPCSFCGQELFGYIPSFVYGSSSTAATTGLASYGSPTRSHYNWVDATPLNFDVDLNNVCAVGTASTTQACTKVSSTPNWHSVLIGGLGKGGKGYYAIDITNPGMLTVKSGTVTSSTSGTVTTTTQPFTKTLDQSTPNGDWTNESAVASKVMWEFPASTDTTTIARMGYSYGAPSVVKTAKYGWVVLFTSGYNNSDGKGYLFIVNPSTGALLETIATSAGSPTAPLNFAQADVYKPNEADKTADAAYGGDLQGNVWRFDLTGTNTYSAPTLMAQLTDSKGNAQPVTTRPLIEIDPSTSKRYLLLGTGRLLANSDINSAAVQSVYSIYDGTKASGGFQAASAFATPLTRSSLVQNNALLTGIGSNPSNAAGWYYDLPVATTAPKLASRVNVDPTALNGIAAFGLNTPTGSTCAPSGTSTTISFNIATGQSVLQDSSGSLIEMTASSTGLISDIAIQNVNGSIRVYTGTTTGTTTMVPTAARTNSAVTRMTWSEIPTQ